MHTRHVILKEISNRPIPVYQNGQQVSKIFAKHVFGPEAMRQYLPEDVFKSVLASIEHGNTLDRKIADSVAEGMKAWAMNHGVTHYTHWFQPLTGNTAEKHDGFFEPVGGGRAIERFSGNQLVQQEPDASSFPNGGVRSTFEARGYTAWDPSSPAFIWGKTLCIPTIFIAYTGESLDYKTPLLRSLHALDKAATEICQAYFDKNVTKVIGTLGWEQEYFLIDASLYALRHDIQQSGRTLFGHAPAKGQQLEDHYWGSIPERVQAFMMDFEHEAHLLGIPVRTRHNEVAPAQFECAPVFEEINIAIDHNQLLMDVMQKVAARHNFRVLFHEKPFAGVNGSGKHNNWSLATNTGKNLLSPGKTPKTNLQFLTFFINVIKAVHDYADLLRASIASASNDHRLGANEAPPAIMSVFIGEQLTRLLDDIEKSVSDKKLTPEEKTAIKLNIGKIPEILIDNTDRNRTSPFAFTGNKFEFRAVGSSANCAGPMTILNAIVARQLQEFKKEVDEKINNKGLDKDEAILQVIKRYIVASKKIRFEGNGYSEEWKKEAQRRGLNNFTNTPDALEVYLKKETISLFKELGVMNETELHARYDIFMETYVKKLQIEGRVIAEIVNNQIIPAAISYQNRLLENIRGLKEIYGEKNYKKYAKAALEIVEEISERVNFIREQSEKMNEARKYANQLSSPKQQAIAYRDNVLPFFDKIRYHVDKLEYLVDDGIWPLPKYREMLQLK